MNKKKSKALAFLLAASLLVPSANGIVSAAELKGSNATVVEQVEGTQEDSTTSGETAKDETVTVSSGNVEDLQNAINKEGVTKVIISKDIDFSDTTVNVSKKVEIVGSSKEITLSGKKIFNVSADGVTIKDLTFKHTRENATNGNLISIGSNITTTIDNCNFTGNPVWNLISNTNKDSKLIFTNNDVDMQARAMIVGVTNGSKIIGNTINLKNEKYNGGSARTGVLSVIADSNKEDVIITGNTFENANRVIGVDNATISGDSLKIKDNKFINTRFAFETDSRTEKKEGDKKELKNKGNSYDLSGNYYKYGENAAGPLRIEDASSKESHFEEGSSTELKIEDKTPLNIIVGPYYTTEDKNASTHAGVATVNGKDYARLEKAIKAAKPGNTVKLVSDITVDTWKQIWNIKGITLDGNGKTIKVGEIKSLENHDAVLHSAGGNIFKNLTIDLSSVKPGKAQGIRAISASDNDVIDNVTIIGGTNASYGITAGSSCKNLTVKNSNISNCGHGVYLEGANDTTVLIKDNTFDGCEYASILYSKNATFEGNTVKGGKVNIMHESNVVQKNTFTKDGNGNASRVKFYTEGNDKTFKYNKLTEGQDGTIGSTVTFATGKNAVEPGDVDLSLNYLGDKDKFDEIIEGATQEEIKEIKDQVFDNASDVDKHLNGGSSTPSVPSIPSKPSKPTYIHEKIEGLDRYETAAKIADKLGSYDTAVLVNATSTMSDGLSAAGLAGKEDAAILLVKKDSIPKATMDRLKKVKKVYIIGGENAISKKVSDEITKNVPKVEVERLGGKDRVETSELVAKEIGNYSSAFIVNGFKGEADAMSASSVAARYGAPILLTNGKTSSHAKKSGVEYYVIGGNTVVDKSIATKYNAEVLAGKDRYATNREVIAEFYSGSDKLYLANGDKLVDALTASPLAKNHGIVLVNKKSDKSILKDKNTVQVGGMDFEIDFE